MADRVTFTPRSAQRIADAVLQVEAGDRQNKGVMFGAPPYAPEKLFRMCTFTGSWSKNALKVVTFKYQSTTPNTTQASNLFAAISNTATTAMTCAIAKEGTAWYLIAAEC